MMPRATMPLLAAVLCGAASGQDPAEHELRVAAPTGTELWMVDRTTSTYDLGRPAARYERTSGELERTLRVTVRQVRDDGSRVLELVVFRLRGTLMVPMLGEIQFDTAEGDGLPSTVRDRPGLAALDTLIAGCCTPVLVRVDRDGNVHDSLAGIAEDVAPAGRNWDRDALQRLAQLAIGRLPNGPVAVGATWQHEQRMPDDALPLLQKETVRLAEVHDDAFSLTVTGTCETADGPAANAWKVRSSELRGTQRLSRTDGFVTSATMQADLELAFDQGGQEQTMKVHTEARLARTTKVAFLAAIGSETLPPLRRAAPRPSADQSERIEKARQDVRTILVAAQSFRAKNGRWPQALEDLAPAQPGGQGQLVASTSDPWGNDYDFLRGPTPRHFDVRSRGPDGEPDTADDTAKKQ